MEYLKEEKSAVNHIRLRKDLIIELIARDDWSGEVMAQEAKENLELIEKLSGNELYPMLAYLPDHVVSKEAQLYYAGAKPVGIAVALISRSMIQNLLGNILINLRQMKTPCKMFRKEANAIAWLEEQRTEYNNFIKGQQAINRA